MAEIALKGIATELGTGAIIGFISGYAAKKVTKAVAVVVGLGLLAAKWLESQGHVNVNWTGVGNGFVEIGTAAAEVAPPLFDTFLSTVGLGGGFAAGFYLGFRRG